MITLQDCLDMCDISEDVVDAIAEHEHLPCILAAELATSLSGSAGGLWVIHRYLVENAMAARDSGDPLRRDRCERALRTFLAAHPDMAAGARRPH